MKRISLKQFSLAVSILFGAASLAAVPASALQTNTTASTEKSTANQATLNLIINRGNSEITRRLNTLNTLSSKINGAAKLTSSDKSSLNSEVSSEISNLTSLKTKLDADTDVTTARTDAQGIITDYRVYALIVPKVDLVKTADDQQTAEAKLSALSTNLQSRITAAQNSGKAVTSLQSSLSDLNSKVAAAQAISSSIESSVIGLQPSDYNSNHSVLSGDRNQLSTAHTDIQAAIADAQSIVTALKND
ncbi:MAG TPA: hypothetical protein VK712_01740 [Verrucomicrobiae bacterium]|jgi:hypothetical protein|nr:hypothetical protein [Verrucomicrobiae bacterium]